MKILKQKFFLALTGVAALATAGCAGMSDTQQRTLSGAAIGTAVGAVAGETVWGAAIGAAGGYLYDQNVKSKERAYQKGYEAGKQNK